MGNYKIKIEKIHCVQHSDPDQHDEVWLLAQSDGNVIQRYPPQATSTHSMTDGDDWVIDDFTIEFDGCSNLTLYEQDLKLDISLTDFLGCTRFTSGASASSSPRICTNGTSSNYEVYFSWA